MLVLCWAQSQLGDPGPVTLLALGSKQGQTSPEILPRKLHSQLPTPAQRPSPLSFHQLSFELSLAY